MGQDEKKSALSHRAQLCALIMVAALCAVAFNQALAVEATEPAQRPELLKGKVRGSWAKANGALRGAVSEFRAHVRRGGAAELFKPSNTSLRVQRGRIVVDAIASNDGDALVQDLKRLGMDNATHYGAVVSGLIPLSAIARAIELKSLRSISASFRPLNNVGTVTSEGVQAMNAISVQTTYAGTGVTVGVLSDSFDQQGGYATDVANGDLPANINVLDDTANCGNPCSDEGRGMMQLIYDVAPGVNLAFHTAFASDGIAGFANGIQELAAAGADIIVDDVIYFAEPMFQDGIIAQSVNAVVNQGKAYFSSAGNYARESYETPFVPSGETLFVGGENRGQLHDFGQAQSGPSDYTQSVTIPALPEGTLVTLVLNWDEPFASAGGPGSKSDVDVYLWDPNNNNTIVASSLDDNLQIGDAIEVLQFRVRQTTSCDIFEQILLGITCVAPGTYELAIAHFTGPQPKRIKSITFRRDIVTEYDTNSSTLFGHANAAGAEAVGAAFYQTAPFFCDPTLTDPDYDDCGEVGGVTTARIEPYSSAGGTPILFDVSGSRLITADVRVKPGVTGPDGTNTSFFFSDSSRDPDTFPNFFGTSASAPHVAAVGALMLHARPDLAPAEMYTALRSTALNMNPRAEGPAEDPDGFDFDTGYGFVQADAAVAAVMGAPSGNNPPTANFNFSTTDLTASFTDTSTDSDGTVASRSWTFGDGGSSTATNPSHTYAAAGTYTVNLTVTDNDGAPNSTSKSVTVTAPSSQNVEIFYSVDPATGVVQLDGSPDGASSYLWAITSWPGGPRSDPNGSLTTNGDKAEFTATKSGDYVVSLTVTFGDETVATTTQTVTVSLLGSGGGNGGCKGGPKKCPPS